MQKLKETWKAFTPFGKSFFIAFTVLVLITTIVLAAISPLQAFLWSGWLYGVGVASLSYGFAYLFLRWVLHNLLSRKMVFSLSMLRSLLAMILQGGFFVILIIVNNAYFDAPLLSGSLSNLASGPLNLFTYLGGMSSIMFSLFIAPFIRRKFN